MANGKTTKPTVMECTLMLTAQSTKDTGKMIYNMALVWRHGLTRVNMRAIIRMERSMGMGRIHGVMGQCMWVNGSTTKLTAKADTHGSMEGVTMEAGRTTTCTASESTRGQMDANTRANTTWTRSMGMASIIGQMEGGMRDIGRMESSMEKGSISCPMVSLRSAYGKMERESDG